MSTLKQLITRIFQNCGKSDAGESTDLILADLLDLLRVDLPYIGGGAFAQGTASLTLGATGSVAEDGVYSFPATLRSFGSALQFVDNAAMPSPTYALVNPEWIYSDPDAFYQQYKSGNAQTDADYGKPYMVLVYGRKIHVRPIPKQTAVAVPWWGTLLVSGTVYLDTTSLTIDSNCPELLYEPLLIAHGTVMEASRRGQDETVAVWQGIRQRREEELASIGLSTWRRTQPTAEY